MRTTNVSVTEVNTTCEAYIAPQVEVIEMEMENVIAGSPTADDNGDPDIQPKRSRDFWND